MFADLRRAAGASTCGAFVDTPRGRLKSGQAFAGQQGAAVEPMSDVSKTIRARPTSPHVQVWRWHLTAITSIMHRITGVALYGGTLILAGWTIALAFGPESYAAYMGLLGSPLGKLVLFGLSLAVFFHLAKGVQHLIWDTGLALKVPAANAGAVATVAFALVATVVVWIIAAMTGAL